jgi:two-component system, LuxR family, sensor kinase FixL
MAGLPKLNRIPQLSYGLRASILGLVMMLFVVTYGLFASEQFAAHIAASRMDSSTVELVAELKAMDAQLQDIVAYERTYLASHDARIYVNFEHSLHNLADRENSLNALKANNQAQQVLLADSLNALKQRADLASTIVERFKSSSKPASDDDLRTEDYWERSAGRMTWEVGAKAKEARDAYMHSLEATTLITLGCVWAFRFAAFITVMFSCLLAVRYIMEQRKMEKMLRRVETKFRAILEQTFQISAVLSPDGILLELSKNIADFPEVYETDFSKRRFWELPWWTPGSLTQQKLQAAIAGAAQGKFTRFEGELITKRGRRDLDLSVRPVLDESSKVSMLVVEAEDITVRKAAERASAERAARLGAILETAPDGIITLNTNGQIESINQAVATIFGYWTDELIGQNIEVLMPDFFQGEKQQIESVRLEAGERTILLSGHETSGKRKDGTKLPVELSVSVLSLENSRILTAIVRDITERKEAQQRVKDFYAAVSHELRTPLSSIRTALGLIEGGTEGGANDSHTAQIVQIAEAESDRLIRLINDLLDIRRIEEGKLTLNYQPITPDRLIDTAVDGINTIADKAGVILKKETKSKQQLECDPDRITQVLFNLISNAIKFSESGDTVTVSAQSENGSMLFSVTDQGPGVDESELHKLFGQFEQLNFGPGKMKHGSGLGLAISKAIVENHKGRIGVDTTIAKGCRFWFELPISTTPAADDKQSKSLTYK